MTVHKKTDREKKLEHLLSELILEITAPSDALYSEEVCEAMELLGVPKDLCCNEDGRKVLWSMRL